MHYVRLRNRNKRGQFIGCTTITKLALVNMLRQHHAEGLDMEQIYEKSITLPFRLLIRIHESMDFWEKEMRSTGI